MYVKTYHIEQLFLLIFLLKLHYV